MCLRANPTLKPLTIMMGSAGTAETTGVRGGRLQFRVQRVVDIHMPMTFLNSNFSHLLPLVCAFTMYTPQTVVKQLEETIREYNNNMQQQGLTHVMIDHIVVPRVPILYFVCCSSLFGAQLIYMHPMVAGIDCMLITSELYRL